MRLKGIYAKKHKASKLGILFLLIFISVILHTIIATGIVYLFFENSEIDALRISTLFSLLGIFFTPILLYSYLCDFDLRFNFSRGSFRFLLLAIVIMFLIQPLISFLYGWNMSFSEYFPDWANNFEEQAKIMTERLLKMNSLGELGFNLLVLAIAPAIAEEVFFRGYVQKKCAKWLGRPHLSIIITAIIFSAIHFQLQGFLPRFMLGLVLGYFMYWSGSIWMPIIGHFLNNAALVVFSYPPFLKYINLPESYMSLSESEIATTWQEAFFSFMAVALLLFLFQKSPGIKKG